MTRFKTKSDAIHFRLPLAAFDALWVEASSKGVSVGQFVEALLVKRFEAQQERRRV